MGQPETRICDYEFHREILRVKSAIDFGPALIERAEQLGGWSRSRTVGVQAPHTIGYDAGRTNDSVVVGGPIFAPFEGLLSQAIHSCVYAYKALNPHLNASRDTHYDLLRYQAGQHFHEHVDVIPGHASWGARVLSVVAFLNDDFEGGELRFSRQDLTIRPVAGDVILFPSGFTHPHAVLPVARGARYAVVTWLI